ncbi:DUF3841 domain-containing protein [Tenacibaculum caenipelagi]|uniref:Uncharacterized protein DUF3841 n=1 Tax=Tenacibaculum caenipelagi TaxID=1325435 RepID=A0A4R6TBM3_9FLAO|nr:DUF3841 domain-containing protein [Tenacibaculum caenipelagi]TDQ23829.1 uncharacterized protein DUF3841 [Tenacibaculum caenipelagi]
MKKVKLWTIQNELGWGELNKLGVLKAKEEYVYSEFKEGYDWMKLQMNKRIGEVVDKEQYPIWAWYQHTDNNKKKPDLRKSGFLPSGEVGYRIEIEKDINDILMSDFVLWHWPLCYKEYIATSEREILELDKGLDSVKRTRFEVEKSWEKIFDMDFNLEYYTSSFENKKIQATFWELKKEEILKVDRFISK